VFSFHFGLPAPALLARIKAWGATVLASATTLDEGRWLERHGADAVIAQGIEAGGHRGSFLANGLTREPTTVELVTALAGSLGVPVIGAGGIGAGRMLKQSLRQVPQACRRARPICFVRKRPRHPYTDERFSSPAGLQG
jgi:nitronate monooxygenase